MCIHAATLLKLNSIKIGTILLTAIFIYDVFFVFITPFLTGGSSVMLDVASGGSESASDLDHCYKYPEECTGIGFLPMLFILPQVNDYADGIIILGLGDIVLPGFLIAFCSRHDEASRLVGRHWPNLGVPVPVKWYNGYFFGMMVAYSIGLLFAYIAVLLMEQGQPALLYICPVCLATLFFLGRNSLKDLWNGSAVFRMADQLITKTERKWGKARMKEFSERRKRDQASERESRTLNYQGTNADSKSNKKQRRVKGEKSSTEFLLSQPVAKDVCFGNENHPGTIALRKAVKEVVSERGNSREEYKPEIYKQIKRKLKDRRFFIKNQDSTSFDWMEAQKVELRKEIGKAYDQARVDGHRPGAVAVSSVLQDV